MKLRYIGLRIGDHFRVKGEDTVYVRVRGGYSERGKPRTILKPGPGNPVRDAATEVQFVKEV